MPWTLCCLSVLGVTSPCVHCLLIKLVWYRGRRPGLLVGTGWEPMYASCKAPTGRWGLCKLGSRLWLGGPACRAKKKKAEVLRLTRASSFFFFARQQTACHKANTQIKSRDLDKSRNFVSTTSVSTTSDNHAGPRPRPERLNRWVAGSRPLQEGVPRLRRKLRGAPDVPFR